MPTEQGEAIDVGALPVVDDADVRAIYPSEQRDSEGTVQQAFVEGQTAMHRRHHDAVAYAAQQSDMLRATREYLDTHAGDRGFHRAVGETQEDFRARLLANPDLVSRMAIVRAVDAILGRYTTARCQVSTSILDRWFVRSEPNADPEETGFDWWSFIERNPVYPDRLYPDSGEPRIRPSSMPGGARAFFNMAGRMLIVRIPDLGTLDGLRGFTRKTTAIPRTGFFVTNSGDVAQGTFLGKDSRSALAIYNAIANAIRGIKGHSVRWTIFIDPRLNEANV